MTVVEAVVFDLDGTLIDSEVVWDRVRRGLAAQDGVPWPEGTTQAMMASCCALLRADDAANADNASIKSATLSLIHI